MLGAHSAALVVGVVDRRVILLSGWVRHGWREPPPPLKRASRALLTPALLCELFAVRTQPQTRVADKVSTVVVLIGQIALARDDADETALRRPDHGRRDRRRDSHLRGLPSLPVRQN